MRKQLKLVAFAAAMLVAGIANAQQISGDITKQDKATRGSNMKSVRVIDNKGTIKYLQVSNGITSFTNNTPSGGLVTTWQLGGTLNTNTTITYGTTQSFTLNGEKFILETIGEVNSTTAEGAAATQTSATSGTYTGYTFLVRDEATGVVKKMLASDILKVNATHNITTVTAGPGITAGGTNTETLAAATNDAGGVEIAFRYVNMAMASYSKVSVFRNGAKLRAGIDYNIHNPASPTAKSRIYLVPQTVEPQDWELYVGDVIEIHATK